MQNGTQASLFQIITGANDNTYIENPFLRMHENLEKYPSFLDDIDDISFIEYDNFERLKPFDAKPGTTVGETFVIPPEDNDTKF